MRNRHKAKVFEKLTIVDTASKGKAVAKTADGIPIFLTEGVPGDVVDIQTLKKRKGYFEGKIIAFHAASEHRTTAVCEHFGVCGGCKWQHMTYGAQLQFKQKEVSENLRRIGGVTPEHILDILGCETPYFYRNKMEFSFSSNRWMTNEEIASNKEFNKNALGFHKPGMWDKIVDINKCHLQADPSNAIRNEIRRYALENGLSFFHPRDQSGFLRTLMLRTTSTGEVMVLLQVVHQDPALTPLLQHIKSSFPEITSLLYVINNKANDTLYDQEIMLHSGRDHIIEEMEGLHFKIGAKTFYQTNSLQAYVLYKITRMFAQLKPEDVVYDLYTGIGTIAQFIAKKVTKVVGVDVVPESIEAAKANALANDIHNAEFEAGDMKSIFTDAFIERHGKANVVITDPPREGMHKEVVEQLLSLSPERIVYVSCNSATQARDLAMLCQDYNLVQSQAVDMFPQTHHVENVVLLEKK
ncbi:23S rRNA (uracil(1939)-C(5))-methyltransferase RlmD [Flavobacteriaceae bacterium]|nr:23S rRNA (uracil(1939)-C(5))-methyltransferase RlmD [Flavobacteriaceae bacterium]